MRMTKVTGTKTVLANMAMVGELAQKKMTAGLRRGALFIQRESMKIVPIDKGHLKGTAFTRPTSKNEFTIGYTAGYAVYVHENLNAQHASGTSAKYLEKIVKNKKNEIISIVKGTF